MNRLHLMTTGQQGRETLERTLPELATHVDQIHLREPHWSAQELVTCIELLMKRGVPAERLIVHDRLDVALVTGIGIQLTTRSIPVDRVRRRFPELRIGQSVHSLMEAAAAEQAGADYVMYGHIFETGSKPGVPPRGLHALKHIVDQTTIPVIAIGGINPANVRDALATGCSGVAVLSGILRQAIPLKAADRFREVMQR
ncbi:thiazole tautomerase TenI [Exiguobacterium sp. K1]|uniref:thiazole tautomerase TenI n=1 Tax=Exiguobacterium sp. K1 TaxID=2980105 RepID=UPI00299CE864|nr:thiazole tautomerase TenI [Exiguobacterium sp. K1]MDX1260783.1 thiazole tautomerase TenI [Exiguobacterium sp. K1]